MMSEKMSTSPASDRVEQATGVHRPSLAERLKKQAQVVQDASPGPLWPEVIVMREAADLIESIKGALGTEEDGAALIEVARNAHRAEQELAASLGATSSEELHRTLTSENRSGHGPKSLSPKSPVGGVPGEEELTHTRSCSQLTPGYDGSCTCALAQRIQLRESAKQLAVYRDAFEELTAKAAPYGNDEDIKAYIIPAGPLHRAAGKIGHQAFGLGEQLDRLRSELEQARAVLALLTPTTGQGEGKIYETS